MAECTVWVAYNTDDECFASNESAQEAAGRLFETFGHGEGMRVVELKLSLPSVKPLIAEAIVPDRNGPVSVKIE